jgi:hypothetical protein
MLRVDWSSIVIPSATDAPAGAMPDLVVLFAEWQAADDKAELLAALDLATAQALTDHIMAHTQRHLPRPRRLPDPALLPEPLER